jgi:hypothetical protein
MATSCAKRSVILRAVAGSTQRAAQDADARDADANDQRFLGHLPARQRRELMRLSRAAGCVGDVAWLAGRHVLLRTARRDAPGALPRRDALRVAGNAWAAF